MDHSGDEEADKRVQFDEAREGLLFAWRRRHRRALILWAFVFASLGLHIVGFYLFQVVPPVQARIEAEPATVTLLDPADPGTAAILRQIDDMLVFLQPASISSGRRVQLEDHGVRFSPSFMEAPVPFRPAEPLGARASEEDRFLMPQDGLVMPVVSASRVLAAGSPDEGPRAIEPARADPAADKVAAYGWSVGGALAGREIVDKAAFAARIPMLEGGPEIRYALWVDQAGRVRHFLPRSGEEQDAAAALSSVLSQQLRFAPAPEPGLVEGWIRFEH